MSECMGGWAGSHEGAGKNKKKTERKKGEDEKSVFLSSFSAFMSG